MKIKTALILCAGYGKRLNPLTLTTPKPLLKINQITLLENCINLIVSLGIKKILVNTFYLEEKIKNFIEEKKFKIEIKIIKDGNNILNTGGGVLNMVNSSKEMDFLVFNPDNVWGENYKKDILIFEEKDSAFFCSVSISQSKKYLLIRTADHQTSEYYTKDLSQINAPIKLFSKRVKKEEHEIGHREGHFYILTNYNECKNFKIMVCEETCFSKENWKEFILYKKNILILDFLILKKRILYRQRFDGLNQIVIRHLDHDEENTIHFAEKDNALDLADQSEFDTAGLRFSF